MKTYDDLTSDERERYHAALADLHRAALELLDVAPQGPLPGYPPCFPDLDSVVAEIGAWFDATPETPCDATPETP